MASNKIVRIWFAFVSARRSQARLSSLLVFDDVL